MGGNISCRQMFFMILQCFAIMEVLFEISWAENVSPPANFVFGDSLVDVGNNNYMFSIARANTMPNGIDFGKPTGRFTNGRTVGDIIGQKIGVKGFIPPYLAPTTTGRVVLQGVNYASGGGGILNGTGMAFVGRINMDRQIDNFANTKKDIISIIGAPKATKLFENALFSITMGANDLINNLLSPIALTVHIVPPRTYVDALISRFKLQLMRLYSMGARKFIVSNVAPLGCIPYQKIFNPSVKEGCIHYANRIAQMYNERLKHLIVDLNANLEGSKFLYGDSYHIVVDILSNYTSYGFESANSACCSGAGPLAGWFPCVPTSRVCSDRSKYVFWDAYHPTEAANEIIAKRMLDGGVDDIWPMNIRKLIES